METGATALNLALILAHSHSNDNATRVNAIPGLGRRIDRPEARERLEAIMVNDKIVTMRVDAAEQLIRHGGENGLLAVLTELGRQRNDSDIDYTAYMLSELVNFGEFAVLAEASAIDPSKLSADAEVGLRNLLELM